MHTQIQAPTGVSRRRVALAYFQMARVDHWFKNTFMFLGVLVAFSYRPSVFAWESILPVALGVLCTCIVASSNYVLNEYLDAPLDGHHPTKSSRPAAQGLVYGPLALLLWGALGTAGVLAGFALNSAFGLTISFFWMMGCLYNLPPIRTKDVPYLDVVSESINNPIRLCLGWFALIPEAMPPLTLALTYWMAGAFFMAAKRFAEYRSIADPVRAATYRKSFRHYNDERLLSSMVFYAVMGAVFAGVFLIRYKFELLLCVPVVAAFFAYYTLLTWRVDSPVQHPERLYKERLFLAFGVTVVVLFVVLMFAEVPGMYDLFNVDAPSISPLWTFD